MRPMSARLFYEQFGGGTASRVSQNFIRLASAGWLRLVRIVPRGGARRGAVEHFYRATEPAYFDAPTWALLPYSLRVGSTWNVYKHVAPRLRAGIEGLNVEAEWARRLTCEQWVLDEIGWNRAIAAVDTHYQAIFEEQQDSRFRAQHDEILLMPADVFIFAFQSAGAYAEPRCIGLVEQPTEPMAPFPERLAPVMRDDLLRAVAEALNWRSMSPVQFYREHGGISRDQVWRRFKGLNRHGWATQVDKKSGGTRRGATEHFYRATKPTYDDFDACADPPESLEKSEHWQTFEQFCADAVGSMEADVFDARANRYVTWSNVLLDGRGREGVSRTLDSLRDAIASEAGEAKKRLKTSKERPLILTLSLAAMDSIETGLREP